jgi:hypothetical protein
MLYEWIVIELFSSICLCTCIIVFPLDMFWLTYGHCFVFFFWLLDMFLFTYPYCFSYINKWIKNFKNVIKKFKNVESRDETLKI